MGFDLGLFDNKLNLVVDYFVAKTEDMLLDVPVPLQSGFTRSLQNVGKMENKGLEIVRYSPMEANIPGCIGGDAQIRFYKNRLTFRSLKFKISELKYAILYFIRNSGVMMI